MTTEEITAIILRMPTAPLSASTRGEWTVNELSRILADVVPKMQQPLLDRIAALEAAIGQLQQPGDFPVVTVNMLLDRSVEERLGIPD